MFSSLWLWSSGSDAAGDMTDHSNCGTYRCALCCRAVKVVQQSGNDSVRWIGIALMNKDPEEVVARLNAYDCKMADDDTLYFRLQRICEQLGEHERMVFEAADLNRADSPRQMLEQLRRDMIACFKQPRKCVFNSIRSHRYVMPCPPAGRVLELGNSTCCLALTKQRSMGHY